MHMEVIVNNKTLDSGMRIIQLETAVGAAMKNFDGAHEFYHFLPYPTHVGINVPRRRFLPVKTCSDLLLVMSNLYDMKAWPARDESPETVSVCAHSTAQRTIPDLLELDHLTVSGDVTFGKGVSLKGTVIIIANHGDRIDIPSGALLENKIVSGNLRILQH
ncbi:UTP--glucose-1-phosphate uridylyltransferase [Desmophyllum pertusum]|uniref:UTP--glucose-1-phosphate uridylyltransferase n=1 Tax=Desmophyllum pertusum TaxID=174260 RepID=A0A9W9YSK3_9CNID|nr:UTP--glucose-1-phosphate uridylyltransferase [Desmophyllum pertusum]